MAPPFTLAFGSLDLAQYLRIGNDEGFDPYDAGGFEEPAFIDNPFGEGQGLANVDSRNREMAWPLYLNATSKDALHDLVGDINREIRYATRPLRVEWKDQDATASTFFDVEFARFDPNFRVRPSARGWLAGVLRVWCKPYGHTGTYRTVGTSTHRGFASYPMPSLAGDIGAHLTITAGASHQYPGVTAASSAAHMLIVAAARPEQHVFIGASRLLRFSDFGATINAASGAIGTAVIEMTVPTIGSQRQALFSLSPSAYEGRNRVIAVFSTDVPTRTATVSLYSMDSLGSYNEALVGNVAPLPLTGTRAWSTVDLGVVELDTSVHVGTQIFSANFSISSGVATPIVRLNGLVILPEDSSLVVREELVQPVQIGMAAGPGTYVLDPDTSTRRSVATGMAIWRSGDQARVGQYAIGALPTVDPAASMAIVAGQLPAGFGAMTPNLELNVRVAARERFTFAR